MDDFAEGGGHCLLNFNNNVNVNLVQNMQEKNWSVFSINLPPDKEHIRTAPQPLAPRPLQNALLGKKDLTCNYSQTEVVLFL